MVEWDDRITQLHEKLSYIFEKPLSILYVGAREGRIEAVMELKRPDRRIDLLEIYHPNVEYFRDKNIFDGIIEGDVRNLHWIKWSHYDIVIWWHGPEHVTKEELAGTLKGLESVADLVILACPWGIFPQLELYGNPYEAHLSSLYPEDFEKYGYHTATLRTPDTYGSNLLAWKELC